MEREERVKETERKKEEREIETHTHTEFSQVLPWAILSCEADLNGATPVPGPTIITGVSWSFGNFKLPFFTHSDTYTSPTTWYSPKKQQPHGHHHIALNQLQLFITGLKVWKVLMALNKHNSQKTIYIFVP